MLLARDSGSVLSVIMQGIRRTMSLNMWNRNTVAFSYSVNFVKLFSIEGTPIEITSSQNTLTLAKSYLAKNEQF